MSNFDALIQDLVIANRILAREEVVDAYGHVSVRHPDNPNRFLIARSRGSVRVPVSIQISDRKIGARCPSVPATRSNARRFQIIANYSMSSPLGPSD